MTQPGRASIEIVGDVSKLGRQLQRDAQRAVDNLDLDTGKIADELGEGFDQGVDQAITKLSELDPAVVLSSQNFSNRFQKAADDMVEAFDEAVPDVQALLDKMADHAQDTAEDIVLHFEKGGVRIERTFKDVDRESKKTFGGIGKGVDAAADGVGTFARIATNAFSKIGDVLSNVGSQIGSAVGQLTNPATLISLGGQIAAYAALTSVIIGLGAALADLVGFLTVLPALVGVAGSAVAVMVIAFQGFGDALSAIVDGDSEKITEALEKLAPAAREVAKEFQKLLPTFRAVGDSIQQEFFEPLVGIIDGFGKRTLPRLRNELDILAQAVGRALGHFGDLVTDSQNVGILERLLASTARITDELGAAFATLGQSFFNAIDAGLPSLERLTGGLADGINNFAGFINESIEDGSFQQFFEEALDTLKELLALGGAVGDLLSVIFGGTDEAGRDFIGTLTDVTQRLTEFFKSAEGQEALEGIGDSLVFIGSVIGGVINAFIWLGNAGKDVKDFFADLGDFFNSAGSDISGFWDGLVTSVSNAVSAVGDFFSDLGEQIAAVWDRIVDGVSGAIDSVVGFFSSLPDRIFEFIQSIPDRWTAFWDGVADTMINAIGFAIGAVIVLFTDLPGQVVGATHAFIGLLAETWNTVTNNVSEAFGKIGQFFVDLWANLQELGQNITNWSMETWDSFTTAIGDAITAAIEFVQSLPIRFGEFFAQAYEAVRARVVDIVNYVKSLPGRILTALGNVGHMLYESGSKIINGLIDGIKSRIGQLRQSIVDAVSQIRDHLPFSPAKVGPLSGAGSPDLAGAAIARMIAEGLDSGLPLLYGAAGRAAGAVADAGVTPLTQTTVGGPSVLQPTVSQVQSDTLVIVQIGDEQIEAYIDKRVASRVETEVRSLMSGSRGV